jgi:hypothetical protein
MIATIKAIRNIATRLIAMLMWSIRLSGWFSTIGLLALCRQVRKVPRCLGKDSEA